MNSIFHASLTHLNLSEPLGRHQVFCFTYLRTFLLCLFASFVTIAGFPAAAQTVDVVVCRASSPLATTGLDYLQKSLGDLNIKRLNSPQDLLFSQDWVSGNVVLWDCPYSVVPVLGTTDAKQYFKQLSVDLLAAVPEPFRDVQAEQWISLTGNAGLICADPEFKDVVEAFSNKAPGVAMKELASNDSIRIGIPNPFSISGFNWLGLFSETGLDNIVETLKPIYTRDDGGDARCRDVLEETKDVVFSSSYYEHNFMSDPESQDLLIFTPQETWVEPNVIAIGAKLVDSEDIEQGILAMIKNLNPDDFVGSSAAYVPANNEILVPPIRDDETESAVFGHLGANSSDQEKFDKIAQVAATMFPLACDRDACKSCPRRCKKCKSCQ